MDTSPIFTSPLPRNSPSVAACASRPPARLVVGAPAVIQPIVMPTRDTSPIDARVIAIIDAPITGETALGGFARKEAELRDAFASLSLADARALHKRLSIPQPGDVVVDKLGRFTAERRTRLVQFLADARRREAFASARR